MSQGQTVQRYRIKAEELTGFGEASYAHPQGGWVQYVDYEALSSRERRMREALQKIADSDNLYGIELRQWARSALAQETREGSNE